MKNYHVQYYSPHTLLVINTKGIIRQLHTPIKVRCNEDVGTLRKGVFLYIDEIGSGENDSLIYYVSDTAYYHTHFDIVANF